MSEADERARVLAAARAWLRTPYHHAGRVKGAGVDCLTLLAEVFTDAGLIDRPEIEPYSPQWHLHRDAERYLEGLLRYTREIDGPPLPGDIVLWKFGRCFSHGAIVVEWPVVIHAYLGQGCVLEDVRTATWLNFIGENTEDQGKQRPKRFFSYWGR